jgi:hypothetical protein
MSSSSLNSSNIEDVLIEIGRYLEKPAKLLLIGSAIGIQMGQPNRMTGYIDVWMDSLDFDYADLKQACIKAGIEFNPKGYDEPDAPYIQIVQKSIVDVGEFDKESRLFKTGNLTVVRPPLEHIIASKLVRGSDTDYDDMLFLFNNSGVSVQDIEDAISTLDEDHREIAKQRARIFRES